MHPKTIIAKMYENDYPPGKVAEDLDVDRATVSEVIHNKKRSYNIATYIAATTKTPLNKLWPNVYTFPPKHPLAHAFKEQFKNLAVA
jgi:hypothetical protein